MQVLSATPLPLAALVIDARDNGTHQLIVSDGRQAHFYVLCECRIKTVADSRVGCSDLGDTTTCGDSTIDRDGVQQP